MAYSSGFFDGDNYYGQSEFNRYFNYLYDSGVGMDDDGNMTLAVTPGTNQVLVAAGFAIVKGFYCYNDAALSLECYPDRHYTRIDRVVVRGNLISGPIEIIIKTGTPASSPRVPALTRNSSVWEISLAQVTITPAGEITITDERPDVTVCGSIRPRDLPEVKTMIANIQSEWDTWFANQQSEGWRAVYIQPSMPSDPAVGSIWIQTPSS